MPQSHSVIVLHVIFSTKNRQPVIEESMRSEMWAYLASVVRNAQCECYRAGGTADHVHLAIRLARTKTVAEVVEKTKTSSSAWMKTRFPELRFFAWQKGYASFSVGPRDLEALCAYISKQEEHHRKKTFKEEYLEFLERYSADYDERYMWD